MRLFLELKWHKSPSSGTGKYEGLKSFFGLEHTVKLKVKVNTLSKDDSPKRQRVI